MKKAVTNSETPSPPSTSPTSETKLDNPWEIPGAFNANEEYRINIDMPKGEVNFFRSIRPNRGTMPALCNTLLLKLKDALIQHGIQHFSQINEFCEFVRYCRIVDGRPGTATSSPAEYRIVGTQTGRLTSSTSPTVASTPTPTGSPANGFVPQTSPPHDGGRKTRATRKNS